MRVSRLSLVTLRDTPAEAELISHQLLVKGGYIRRVTAGIYAYLPLMWRVIKKITQIVQHEMDLIDCHQTLLPQLHPASLWEKTGRWQGYTGGEGIMFHLRDRQGRELGLGPTHEEVITSLAGELINSYKQLPTSFYQIQTKFRDEIRPRFGLMRSREFIMKDAYSFHADELDLQSKYEEMNNAYKQIFANCGLQTVIVDADSGAIGGAASQEFMVTAKAGEDLILISTDGIYSANQEKAISKPADSLPLGDGTPCSFNTPNQKSINDLSLNSGIEPSQVIKVIILLAELEDKEKQPLLISIRGDQELNEVKLTNEVCLETGKNVLGLTTITKEKIKTQGLEEWPFGFIAPDFNDSWLNNSKSWNKTFLRLADLTVKELSTFICGSNQADLHRKFMRWDLLGGIPKTVDIRKAKAGDTCMHDPKQKLIEKRGIEIGHIFQLGKKYSKALDTNFTNENGIQEPFWMGCYGIGITRLAQAAIEQNHDDDGICWPTSIAPFEVLVVIANIQNPTQNQLGEKIYQDLKAKDIDVLLDDRAERAGVKFKDGDLIGIPWRLVIGRDAERGKVELINRANKAKDLMTPEEAIQKLLDQILPKRFGSMKKAL